MYATITYTDKEPDTNPVRNSEVKALSYLREALVTCENIRKIELFADSGKCLHMIENTSR